MSSIVIESEVLKRGPSRFNLVGRSLPCQLFSTDEQISAGTVKRLYQYALSELKNSGFNVVEHWKAKVYTMDGDMSASDRIYCVEFIHELGGTIGVEGIMTKKGWPFLHHGFNINGK